MRNYCPLCGVWIRASVDNYRYFPVEDLEWYQLLRAVDGCEEEFVALTGVGYFNQMNEVVAPQNPEYFYWDPRAEGSMRTYRLVNEDNSGLTFLFHAACWNLLLDRVAYGNYDINKIAGLLFQVLYSTHLDDEGIFQPGHDYGGVARFRVSIGSSLGSMVDRGYGYCLVEPSRFTSTDDLLDCLGPQSLPEKGNLSSLTPSQFIVPPHDSVDRFTKLPPEVIHLLLSWLPSDTIHQLRLASRSVASKSQPDALPQLFWQSRFIPEFEMGFALPERTEGYRDWRALYFKVKQGLESNGPSRLRNRKRIWDIVSKDASVFAEYLPKKGV